MIRLADLGVSGPTAALVGLSRREEAGEFSVTAEPAFREPEFQAAFATLAQQHGLFGLVLLALGRTGLFARLPEEVAEEYARSLRLLRRQAALWDLERDFVLTLLAERGVPAVLLKGAALRLTAYRDPVQRPFGDLDILVPIDAVDRAVSILGEAGYRGEAEQRARLYREHHHHLILRKEIGFIVEVHWALEPMRSPFLLDPESFRQDSRIVATGNGMQVRVPSPEHFVLHLSAQSVEDGFSRLGRIVDLDRVVAGAGPAFDWGGLAAEAIRMRVNAVVALSLRLAELLYATPVPAGFYDRLQLTPASRGHLAMLDPIGLVLERRSQQRAGLDRLVLLWSVADGPARRAVLRAMLTGEHDWFGQLLPPDGAEAGKRRSQTVATLKLGLLQVWVYLSAVAARLRGLRRVGLFWSSGLDSSL